jgi:hypothetical protein
MAKEECFIIAPITTPDDRVELYEKDVDHFKHVIDHLLVPAVKLAGFEPIPPIAKGADLIHAEIIKWLQEAPMVLCDMSGANPNVFFELGIRTALNKPVCLLRDDLTEYQAFDLSVINHHTYKSHLGAWNTDIEIPKIAEHIKRSAKAKDNNLWKYFGLKIVADTAEKTPGAESDTTLLRMEMTALRRAVESTLEPRSLTRGKSMYGRAPSALSNMDAFTDTAMANEAGVIEKVVRSFARARNIEVLNLQVLPPHSEDPVGVLEFSTRPPIPPEEEAKFNNYMGAAFPAYLVKISGIPR